MNKTLVLVSLVVLVQMLAIKANAQMNLLETKREAFERRQAEKYYWEKNHPYALNGAPQNLSGNYPSLPQRSYQQVPVYSPSANPGYSSQGRYGY